MSFSASSARLLITTVLCSAVVACSPFKTERPASHVTLPAQFTATPSSTQATDLTTWWTAWQDPLLTRLVQQALAANPDIRMAQARVQESRAYTRMARSALYPTIGATAGMMGGGVDWRHPVPPLLKMADPNIQDAATDGHLAGITMAWEPDIWGGNRAKARGAHHMALATEDSLHGIHMAIAADVAANYVTARGLQQRIELLDQSVSTLQSLLRYASARFDAGQTTQADLETIRGQIAQVQAQRPLLVSALDACRHRLAILSGLPPEQAPDLATPSQYHVPPAPVAGLPSTVLDRRPDVLLEKHLLEASLQRLISTKTDLLPRFGLEFFGGDGRLRFDGIPGVSGTGGLMAVNTYLPLFTAGRIQARIRASDAELQQALAAYDRTVLTALAEVEDAYENRSSADQSITSLTADVNALSQAASQARGLYEGGRFTMQDVLTTRIKKISAQDDLVSARTRQALASVQLARALGGGWSSPPPAAVPSATSAPAR